MEITLGQQYNVGEKPTVILYTYINRHAGTPEIIICYYMGYKYKATTWYLTGFHNGSNLGVNSIMSVRNPCCCRCYAFGYKCAIVAIRGEYRMARGWRYTKLFLSSALHILHVLCVFLSFGRF